MNQHKTSASKRAAQRAYREKRHQDPAKRAADLKYFKDYRRANREHLAAKDRAYVLANATVIRLKRLGLDPSLKDRVESHNGRCDICGGPGDGRWKMLTIDHCHKTHAFRGLLCSVCNRGLGFFKDNPDLLRRAIGYLGRAV